MSPLFNSPSPCTLNAATNPKDAVVDVVGGAGEVDGAVWDEDISRPDVTRKRRGGG